MAWYVTVYPHIWGRGRTAEEAKKVARKHGGRGAWWYTKKLPEGAKDPYVDHFGAINWDWEEKEPEDYVHAQLPVVAYGREAKKDLQRQGQI